MKKFLILIIIISLMSFIFSNCTFAKDYSEIFSKINGIYYDLSKSSFNIVNCDIKSYEYEKLLVNSTLEPEELSKLENPEFHLSFSVQMDVPFEFSYKLDKIDCLVFNGWLKILEQKAITFFSTWLSIVSEPIFDGDEEVVSLEKGDNFILTIKHDGIEYDLVYDKNYVIKELVFYSERGITKLILEYTKSTKGLIPINMKFDYYNGMAINDMAIKYIYYNGFYLPARVEMKNNVGKKETVEILEFSGYTFSELDI